MTRRAWAGLLVALALCGGGQAAAQDDGRQELARDLARLMLDEPARRALDEQVSASLLRGIGATLEERLSRRLLELEWRIVADIVSRFVSEALPSSHAEEIAARAYARHFDAAELGELLRFQQSPAGRKATRLTPLIRSETAQAMDADLRESPAMPRMLEELQREFPVLKSPEAR